MVWFQDSSKTGGRPLRSASGKLVLPEQDLGALGPRGQREERVEGVGRDHHEDDVPVAGKEALVAEEVVVGGGRGDDGDLLEQQPVRLADRVGVGRRPASSPRSRR